jgi:hypothetical protein
MDMYICEEVLCGVRYLPLDESQEKLTGRRRKGFFGLEGHICIQHTLVGLAEIGASEGGHATEHFVDHDAHTPPVSSHAIARLHATRHKEEVRFQTK